MNDRELMLQWQEQEKVAAHAIDQVGHYQALAVGLAAFCHTFLATILDPAQNQVAVTRKEALQILVGAVKGR